MALDQCRGQHGLPQQLFVTVDVLQDQVEQSGSLYNTRFDLSPLIRANDHGEEVKRPGPLLAVLVGINVVGDAVVTQLAIDALLTPLKIRQTLCAEVFKKP